VQALRAMHVRATVQCDECNKLRAVYCKQALRSLEKLHAGRRAVVPDDTGSDSNAADGNGSDGMGRGSAVGDETLSQRGARRCSQRALTAGIVQDAIDSSLSASESDVTQDNADLDAHADSGSAAIAEMDASADEVQLQVHANAGADADSRGHAGKRMRPCVAKRGRPSGQAGRASAHGPGTYVYDEVQAACDSTLYTFGAVLMPVGHALDPVVYCNVALTCAAPVESTLYSMSASAMNQPLVVFSKGLCSICGIEQVSDEGLEEQGCSGRRANKWTVCPLCVGCAAQGFKASTVRKTREQIIHFQYENRSVRERCRQHALRLFARARLKHHLTGANKLCCKRF
jgi:hypothetical protein